MHGIYIGMHTVPITSPQGAVLRGIAGQRGTYRAYRALFSRRPLLRRKGKSSTFRGPLDDLVRLVRLVRTKLQPAACIFAMHE